MKAVKTLFLHTCIGLFATGTLLPVFAYSQCTLQSVSYNMVIPGTGNDTHTINIPQFNPAKGALVAVKVSSVISLQYAFQLENNSHSAATCTVGIGRNDYIGSSALSSPLTNMGNILKNYGPYSLGASDGVAGSGTDYISVPQFSVLNNYTDINDSITAGIGGFLGTGNVEFDYFTTTYNNVSSIYTYKATANDVISFTVTYYYCVVVELKSTIIDFNATLQKNSTINLAWQTANDQSNRIYAVQKSSDGLNFDEVTKISSNPDSIADYFYNYDPTPSDKNEIFFRLKVTDQNNNINYSEIRTVVLSEPGNSISLYPNPSNSFVNVVFSHPINNVLIEILSPTGELIQKYRFNNTSLAHINLISLLPPGVYFIRAYDLDLKKNYVLPFMTQ